MPSYCISLYLSKQEREQETTKGSRNKRPPTNADQQRFASHRQPSPGQATAHASNQHTVSCATEAPAADTAGRHPSLTHNVLHVLRWRGFPLRVLESCGRR